MIDMLFQPFILCIGLVFIHVYFGTFVLKRGILFIDLALAQWAALGYLVGAAIGIETPWLLFMMGFFFTSIAGLILTIIKPIFSQINYQEAVIGIIYIFASAVAVALLTMTGLEGHHWHDMMSGYLLLIQPAQVMTALLLYAGVGFVMIIKRAYLTQSKSLVADWLFYSLFGLVVTSSVKLVGVLLVFSFLVLPVMSVVLFTSSIYKQVLYGWGLGLCGALVGLVGSIYLDVSPSISIMLGLCIAWVLAIIGYGVSRRMGWGQRSSSLIQDQS